MHRRKNYRKPVMTRLPASVGIAMTGAVGTTGGNRVATTVAMTAVTLGELAAVAGVAANSARSAVAVVAVVTGALAAGIGGMPGRVNCRNRRMGCA
jgi:hypothetical protein